VLIVDDERDIVELLAYNLQRAGFETAAAFTGRQALEAVASHAPDLIVLDVMLPEISGTEVASRIRTNPATSHIPILMLTAKTEEVDQIVGLTVGADDYVTKPFSVKVVLARIDAVLRRSGKTAADTRTISLGPVEVDPEMHHVTVAGQPVKLTLTEFRLLAALAQGKGRVLSRHVLMSKAMGPGVTVTERTIDVHVTSIRKKLGEHAWMIKTVRGVGYRATTEREPADAGVEE
jgi:two-component system phosphate regulon response regulator PhoB